MTKTEELRILKNFINCMTKTYRSRTANWCVVRDILMGGTPKMGSTSCIEKCTILGIDPFGYEIIEEV